MNSEIPETPKDPYESEEYKCYREDLNQAKTTRLEVFKIYASYSLAISGGLIAAIGYLIKEFYHLQWIPLLLTSALLATFSLVAAMFELIFSQVATIYLEKKIHKEYKNENIDTEKDELKHYQSWCTTLLYAIPWLILSSVLAIAIFLLLNLHNLAKGGPEMSEEKTPRNIIKCIVTDTSDKPNQGKREIANVITDGPTKPKTPQDPQNNNQQNNGSDKPKK